MPPKKDGRSGRKQWTTPQQVTLPTVTRPRSRSRSRTAHVISREIHQLMDVSDYVDFKMHNMRSEQAIAEFKTLTDNPSIEREGEGADVKLWITKSKTRHDPHDHEQLRDDDEQCSGALEATLSPTANEDETW